MMGKKKIITVVSLLAIIIASAFFIFLKIREQSIIFPLVNSDEFSVVVLPDIQNYSSQNPDILCNQVQWIIDHKKDLNIVFVSQLGDLVNNGGQDLQQWGNATRCLNKLDGIIPLSVIPGNHDLDIPHEKNSGFLVFNKYFSVDKYKDNSWYGGSFEGNQNNFEILNINGFSLLFLNLEIEPSDEVLGWAETILEKYPKAHVILTTHKYLAVDSGKPEETLAFSKIGNTGKDIWNKLIFNNCSIFMTLSGHFHGENRIVNRNNCGVEVNQILQDYQDRPDGGEGWLRVYIFSPRTQTIKAYTYSPYLSKMEVDPNSFFTLPLDFTPSLDN